MSDQKKPVIPVDHPIIEIWKINKLNTEGFIELAKAGDKAAAETLMKWFVYLKDSEKRDKQRGVTRIDEGYLKHKETLENYIIECIRLSYQSNDANVGFNLKSQSNNRPKANYLEQEKYCRIGYRVAQLMDEYPSKNKAYQIAALEFDISEGKARMYYEKYMVIDDDL